MRPSAKRRSRGSEPEGGRAGAPGSADGRRRVLGRPCGAPMSERGRARVDGVCRACRGSSPAASTVVQTASRSTVVGCWSWMTVRCESAREQVIVQVSLVVSSSKSRVAATWLGGVDCDVASRQSSSSRIRLGWRHSLDWRAALPSARRRGATVRCTVCSGRGGRRAVRRPHRFWSTQRAARRWFLTCSQVEKSHP